MSRIVSFFVTAHPSIPSCRTRPYQRDDDARRPGELLKPFTVSVTESIKRTPHSVKCSNGTKRREALFPDIPSPHFSPRGVGGGREAGGYSYCACGSASTR